MTDTYNLSEGRTDEPIVRDCPRYITSLNRFTFSESEIRRARYLFHFLPYGAISKQTLTCITEGNKEESYHLVRSHLIEKRTMLLDDSSQSKTIISYNLTAKGFRYLQRLLSPTCPWLAYCSPPNAVEFRGCLSTPGVSKMLDFQNATAFFTMANINTITTELWNATPYAILTLLGMKDAIASKASTLLLDILLPGLFKYYENNIPSESIFINECKETFDRIVLNKTRTKESNPISILSKNYDFTPYVMSPANYNKYGNSREVKFLSRVTNINATNRNTFQDNCLGIYSGKNQDISVYITSKYGFWYSTRLSKKSSSYNSVIARVVSMNTTRRTECRCKTGIILCRTVGEMVNVIIDKNNLRKDSDKEIGSGYESVYLVPMTQEGMRMMEVINEKNPLTKTNDKKEEQKALASLFPNLQIKSGVLVDTNTSLPCINGIDLDVKEIYQALNLAKHFNSTISVICEDWQVPFYNELIAKWKTCPALVDSNSDIALLPISLEYSPFTASSFIRNADGMN